MLHLPQAKAGKAAPPIRRARSEPVDINPARSEIVTQCVIYLQAHSAYVGGFKADRTGNWDYAGAGAQLGRAQLRIMDRALARLNAISLECVGTDRALEPNELHAKSTVLSELMKVSEGSLEHAEILFVSLLASEVSAFIKKGSL